MPAEDLKETLKQAKTLFDQGSLAQARDLLERGLPGGAQDSRLLNFLAYLHYKLDNLPRARDLYRRLTSLEPDNLSVWSNLGLVAMKMGLLDEARRAFEAFLERKPDDPKVRDYLEGIRGKTEVIAGATPAAGPPVGASASPPRPEALQTPVPVPAPPSPPAEAPAEAATPSPADAVSLGEWIRLFQEEEVQSSHQYHSLSSCLVGVRLDNRVVFALPSLTMYHGITVFGQGPNPYGKIPRSYRSDDIILMAAEGNGTLWLTHDASWLVTLSLNHEALCLNAHRLVAFDDTVECEWIPLGKERFLPGLAALRLSGRGRVVLALGGGLVSAEVKPGTSLYLRPSSVVAWTDGLRADVDGGEDLKKVKGFFDGPFLRFEGMGRVFVAAGTGRG